MYSIYVFYRSFFCFVLYFPLTLKFKYSILIMADSVILPVLVLKNEKMNVDLVYE